MSTSVGSLDAELENERRAIWERIELKYPPASLSDEVHLLREIVHLLAWKNKKKSQFAREFADIADAYKACHLAMLTSYKKDQESEAGSCSSETSDSAHQIFDLARGFDPDAIQKAIKLLVEDGLRQTFISTGDFTSHIVDELVSSKNEQSCEIFEEVFGKETIISSDDCSLCRVQDLLKINVRELDEARLTTWLDQAGPMAEANLERIMKNAVQNSTEVAFLKQHLGETFVSEFWRQQKSRDTEKMLSVCKLRQLFLVRPVTDMLGSLKALENCMSEDAFEDADVRSDSETWWGCIPSKDKTKLLTCMHTLDTCLTESFSNPSRRDQLIGYCSEFAHVWYIHTKFEIALAGGVPATGPGRVTEAIDSMCRTLETELHAFLLKFVIKTVRTGFFERFLLLQRFLKAFEMQVELEKCLATPADRDAAIQRLRFAFWLRKVQIDNIGYSFYDESVANCLFFEDLISQYPHQSSSQCHDIQQR